MTKTTTERTQVNPTPRLNFSKIPAVIEIPNLIEIQVKSFENFLQSQIAPEKRNLQGLEEVFQDVFPISDLNINARLEFVGYEVGGWECGCGEYKELGGVGVICEACGQEVT